MKINNNLMHIKKKKRIKEENNTNTFYTLLQYIAINFSLKYWMWPLYSTFTDTLIFTDPSVHPCSNTCRFVSLNHFFPLFSPCSMPFAGCSESHSHAFRCFFVMFITCTQINIMTSKVNRCSRFTKPIFLFLFLHLQLHSVPL